MPALIEIEMNVPHGSSQLVSGVDVHRLACYLLEDRDRGAHTRQRKDFAVRPPVMIGSDGEHTDLLSLQLSWLSHDPVDRERLESRLGGRPNLGLDVPIGVRSLSIVESDYSKFLQGPGARRRVVEFLTPTTYSRNGRDYLLPDPVLVHRGLVTRWNECGGSDAAFEIPDELARSLYSKIMLVDHELQVAAAEAPVSRAGFIGYAIFQIGGQSTPEESGLFATLWRFAEYCGLGASTTYGMGAIAVRDDGDEVSRI